jgi:RNA polymerase sigma-70 factor (ECF subfamily)
MDEKSSKGRIMSKPTTSSQSGQTAQAVDRPIEPNPDQLLIRVGNSGDRQAFNQLFKLLSGKVFAQGMKILRNEQLARDLVQEAMLAVWQKASLYDVDKGSAQSWIFTLVRNRCFDILRKQQRQPSYVSADDIWPTGDLPATDEDRDEQIADIEQTEMQQLYSQLPEAQREVVIQVFVQGKTHQEAAESLAIPLGTVKSRLRLALEKLKKQLVAEDDPKGERYDPSN